MGMTDLLHTALVVGGVAAFWAFVEKMKARDLKKLAGLREGRERRASERAAAIAERVSKLSRASGPTQKSVPD